jgi:hypothetical protein
LPEIDAYQYATLDHPARARSAPPPEEWGALIRAPSARSKGTEATDLKREAAVHLGDADRRFD